MPSDFSVINGRYIQYSCIFHTFPENNRTGYLPEKTHAVPTCRWGGLPPAASGQEYSSLQRKCTEFPYAIPLLVDTAIVQKEECFVECTKPPVLRQAKPGDTGSVCNVLYENKKSEPVPDWEVVRFFHVWWSQKEGNHVSQRALRNCCPICSRQTMLGMIVCGS